MVKTISFLRGEKKLTVMRSSVRLILVALVLIAIALPASAFEAQKLTIDIAENGDAAVRFDYRLSWIEQFFAFIQIVHPDQDLGKLLEGYSHKEVQVTSTSPDHSAFQVAGFAQVITEDGGVTYVTPALTFGDAQAVLKEKYPYAAFLIDSLDISPNETAITFSDGYQVVYPDQDEIPRVTHTVE
jgi:hypothetical protein